MNIKLMLDDAISLIAKSILRLSPKDAAVGRLGLGYALASAGERLKKAAKKELTDLAILPDRFEPGLSVLFDSTTFRLTAKTSEAARRLSEDALREALDKEKLSAAARARIMAGAFKESARAVTFEVESK